MAAVSSRAATEDAIARVRASLRGDVAAIYRDLVPALNNLSTERIYEIILGSPDVLDGCFQVFRARRRAFASLLVDADGHSVEGDDTVLSCGRTVADIIAMSLRSATRRYLRRELGGPRRRPRQPKRPPGLGGWLRRTLLGEGAKPSTVLVPGPGDRLYMALRDLLRYEWQARLIPYYAPLPESLVREMGDRLLDYRDPADLTALAEEARRPRPEPKAGTGASDGEPAKGRTLGGMREEDIWTLYQEAELHRRLGVEDPQKGRRLVALSAAAGPMVDGMLKTELALGRLQAVAAACACADVFGPGRFMELFSEPEDGVAVGAWRQSLRDSGMLDARGADAIAEAATQAAMMAAAETARTRS